MKTLYDETRSQILTVLSGDKRHPSHPTFAQSLKTDLGKALFGFFRALVLLIDNKQLDYGSNNLTQFGGEGVVVRLADKVSRLRNLLSKGQPMVVEESILDTWSDAIGYQAIGYLIQARLWPFSQKEIKGSLSTQIIFPEREKQPPTFHVDSAEPPPVSEAATRAVPISATSGHLEHFMKLTRDVVLSFLPEEARHDVPQIGALYHHIRVPCIVKCEGILPSYSEHMEKISVGVLFSELSPPQSVPQQLAAHLRIEPLGWFNGHYRMEEKFASKARSVEV